MLKELVWSPMESLNSMKYRPSSVMSAKTMTLGTAQFGLDYGIANRNGQVPRHEAVEIIKCAIKAGVEYIDTASAYGESEAVIGEALTKGWPNRVKIVTKLPPFEDVGYSGEEHWRQAVRDSVLKSCIKLGCKTIDTLMLHRATHLAQEEIVDELKKIRSEGLITKIGVSVQSPSELELALLKDCISVIQMPFNILDYRWNRTIEKIKAVKESRNLIVHARSVLLQGLLCSRNSADWGKAGIKNQKEIFSWLDCKFKEHSKASVSDLCIGYVNSQSWVDSVVIGVNTKSNLKSNLRSVSMPMFNGDSLEDIRSTAPKVPETSLNPLSWS